MVDEAEKMSEKDKEKKRAGSEEKTSLTSLSTGSTRVSRNLATASLRRRKKELEQALEEGREALKSDDPGKIDPATERITAVSHKLAELMYKKTARRSLRGRWGGWG